MSALIRRLWFVAVSALVAAATPAAATDLRVGPVTTSVSGAGSAAARRATVTVSWQNGWRTARNYDAVWLFVKTGKPQTALRHVRIAAGGHEVIVLAGPPGRAVIPDDRTGIFVIPDADHRGRVEWRVQITFDPGQAGTDDVRVFALEMVYVPAGPFTLGDPDPAAIEFNAVYRSNARGEPAGLFRVTSEGPIDVGPREGAFFYKTQLPQYEGDRMGPIPETFPKGVAPFYTMKYELTQGQYVDFLNALYSGATFFRSIHGGRDYATARGAIRLEGRDYVAGVPARPANWISWDDGLAFADWAGLRPMTELEFTKAARGPGDPVAHEFPWGTGSAERLRRVMRADDDLATGGEADEARLSDETRDILGASFYWVMDLAGSVWERVVTFGHPRGRAFRGTHGDGRVTEYGQATNDDWPIGDPETGGYGYRGGGYYERGMTMGPFNPYSPIAYRRYGSWGGGPRSIAYGFRAVRTAPASRPDDPALSAALQRAAAEAPGTIGISVVHIESGRSGSVNPGVQFPMMSVYKLPIVIHALRLSERERLDLSERVILMAQDRRPGASAMAQTIAARGPLTVSIREIITAIVTTSDNTASDWLLRRIGGPKAVAEMLRSLNLHGVDVSRYELEFAADYYGLCCVADMRPFSLEKFAAAAEAVPAAVRAGAAKAYESDQRDSATPAGFTTLLVKLYRRELLHEASTMWLLDLMQQMHARDGRIRAGLPSGTAAALRPGTSGLTAGVRAAHNDSGIVRLPAGRGHLAIAVFLKGAGGTEAARDAAIARAARAAYDWAMAAVPTGGP